jgi:pSer/pThr/pTyr-binding forkhead associated (FHA) protein
MTPSIVLHLLDVSQGHPLQSWTFQGEGPISIGRATANDVVLADPFVSRTHARLERGADGWHVVALSDQQVLCGGQRHRQLALEDGAVFQLGPHGCRIRFCLATEGAGNRATMAFDSATMPVFQVDTQRLEKEVNDIASGDYFLRLQQAAEALRRRRGNR